MYTCPWHPCIGLGYRVQLSGALLFDLKHNAGNTNLGSRNEATQITTDAPTFKYIHTCLFANKRLQTAAQCFSCSDTLSQSGWRRPCHTHNATFYITA